MAWRTRTCCPLHITAEPTDGVPHPHPSKPSTQRTVDIFLMLPSPHPTESRPRTIGDTPVTSAPDRAPRDYQPLPGVERIRMTGRQPANHPGPSPRPTKCTPVPDKAPRDERPLPGAERITPAKHQPANRLGPSHLQTTYTHVPETAPRDERPPLVGERMAPTRYQPPDPSRRPISSREIMGKSPPYELPRKRRSQRYETIVFPVHQPTNPPGPTDSPAESAPVLPSNDMLVNITGRIPKIVRSKMLSDRFANNSTVLVPNV